jgi:hypothetical protein
MTDGKSDQDQLTLTRVINRLKRTSDPLIGAGIGTDTDTGFLLTLASNISTVVYEPDRNQPIRFGKRIIEVMRDSAALCADEGIMNYITNSNILFYCFEVIMRNFRASMEPF